MSKHPLPVVIEALESRTHLAADLVVTAIRYPGGTYTQGQPLRGSITVKNIGTTSTDKAFATTLALSTDTTFGGGPSGSIFVDTSAQAALSPGKSRTVRFDGTVVSNAPIGNYHLVARVDSGLEVEESNEANNDFASPAANIAVGSTVRVVALGKSVVEGSTKAARFMFVRNGGSADVPLTVSYTLGGTAQSGVNFDATNATGTIEIPAKRRNVVLSIPTLNDNLAAGNKTLQVNVATTTTYNVAAAPANSGAVTIIDSAPQVAITATDPTAIFFPSFEDKGTFTVTRTGPTTNPITINYTTAGTAIAGFQYQALPGSVTIPAGRRSAKITVTATALAASAPSTVIVLLAQSSAYNILTGRAVATINLKGFTK